jgi:hypothetical protein
VSVLKVAKCASQRGIFVPGGKVASFKALSGFGDVGYFQRAKAMTFLARVSWTLKVLYIRDRRRLPSGSIYYFLI